MDDPALSESVFFQDMLHYMVVFVGIDAKMSTLFFTEIHTVSYDSFQDSVAGNPMNGPVGGIGNP